MLNGEPSSSCKNGIWIPSLGSCQPGLGLSSKKRNCDPISGPKNAKIFYIQSEIKSKYEVGSMAILICDKGFAVHGRSTATCTNQGWSNDVGFCQINNSFNF
ncbi:unnamed protein product [Dracunculus medinensis]|uniref:Sushi domain-containing protein n=1 Tax=Dracunculus medinensis TaxID=318479 RepID=A0A0N4UGY5_DRAME|nr:unnamed protein product [Dracunculus medinensis]